MALDIYRRRIALTANAAVFVNFLTYLGLTPLYAEIAHDLHLSASGFGQYFLVQGLINVVLQVPVGVLADRYGRRPIMLIGLACMLGGQLLRWQAYDGAIFLASQVLIGLCGPFIVSASYALLADAYREGRARAFGILQASINVGQGTGFLLAGLLAPGLGWRGYSLVTAALPVLLLPLTLTLREARQPDRSIAIGASVTAALRFLALPAAAALAAVAALNLGTGSGAIYLIPFLAQRNNMSPSTTSLLLIPFLLGSIVGGPVAGSAADRFGVRIPALACFGTAIVGLVVLALASYGTPAVALCLALIGLAVSGMLVVTAESVIAIAARLGVGAGAALGGVRIGQGLGPALAPAAAGVIFDRYGATPAFLAMAASMAIAAGLLLAARIGAGPRAAAGS